MPKAMDETVTRLLQFEIDINASAQMQAIGAISIVWAIESRNFPLLAAGPSVWSLVSN
jgi:hypothetical protein